MVRIRLLGSRIPILRTDQDVLFPEEESKHYNSQLAAAIYRLVAALEEHQRHTPVLATIMSGNYEAPQLTNSPSSNTLSDWTRGFATRIQPALIVIDPLSENELDSLKYVEKQNGGERHFWRKYAQTAFEKQGAVEVARKFYRGLWEWGSPVTAIVSGALLMIHDSVVQRLPPFSNYALAVSWIDDHLAYALHRELGDFCRRTVTTTTGQPLNVRLDSAQVLKCRDLEFEDLPAYTVTNYLPSLLWGAIMDAWISEEPLVKKRFKDIESEVEGTMDSSLVCAALRVVEDASKNRPLKDLKELKKALEATPHNLTSDQKNNLKQLLKERWEAARDGGCKGPLTKLIEKARQTDEDLRKAQAQNDLREPAITRYENVKKAWEQLTIEDEYNTFASAWAKDQLPCWVRQEIAITLERRKNKGFKKPDSEKELQRIVEQYKDWYSLHSAWNGPLQKDLSRLIGDAHDYLEWLRVWPRFLHVVQSHPQGQDPFDFTWC